MKLNELKAVTEAKPPVLTGEVVDEEVFEEDEVVANLTEALAQLESCVMLLSALEEVTDARPSKLPIGKYFKKEITRVRLETINLLIQYDMFSDLAEVE